jgi:hypothetical protein
MMEGGEEGPLSPQQSEPVHLVDQHDQVDAKQEEPAVVNRQFSDDLADEYADGDEYDYETTFENILPLDRIKSGWGVFTNWAKTRMTEDVVPAWEKTKVRVVYYVMSIIIKEVVFVHRKRLCRCGRLHVTSHQKIRRY